jgi:hypothetical protein
MPRFPPPRSIEESSASMPKAAVHKLPDWSRPLPEPLSIPTVMDLATLADVRELLGHLPEAHRARDTWRYVATKLDEAARGAPVIDLIVPLRMVLSMEGIACRPK